MMTMEFMHAIAIESTSRFRELLKKAAEDVSLSAFDIWRFQYRFDNLVHLAKIEKTRSILIYHQ
jgi:hypothetical protein